VLSEVDIYIYIYNHGAGIRNLEGDDFYIVLLNTIELGNR
jgi:hypothetical protein